MDCAEELRQIEDKLGHLPGVTNLRFDLMNRRLTVEGSIASPEIQRALKDIGMAARPEGEEARQLSFWEQKGRLVLTIVSGLFLGLGLALDWSGLGTAIQVPLFALATVAGAWFIAPRALRAATNLSLDINFLMLVSAVGASLIGEWAEGASVVFLFSVAQVLETSSMDRARNAIKALMDLSPTEATVNRDGQEVTIPAAEARVGEVIVIRPGQKIPLDGEVLTGRSAVNQAPITGESIPVDKEPGSEVFAGIDQRARLARGPRDEARRGHDARSHHPRGRRGPGNPGALAIVRRPLLPGLHARRSSPSPSWCPSSRRSLASAPGACGSTGPWRCSSSPAPVPSSSRPRCLSSAALRGRPGAASSSKGASTWKTPGR